MPIKDRVDLDWKSLPFGYLKAGINVRYVWRDGRWDDGIESEDEYMPLHIAATCTHYGQAAFEGLKIYEARDGRVLSFRVEENAKRMAHSANMMMMKAPPVALFKSAVQRIVRANQRFIPPHGTGASLYVRPLLIGTGARIGVRPADEYTFLVLTVPVGPYFKSGFTPTKLIIDETRDRAAPQGMGSAKAGGNYAAGMCGTMDAKAKGYGEALYLDAREHKYLEELGAANFFGIRKDNRYVTPKSPAILRSITNMSLRTLAADMGYTVEERHVPVEELNDFIEAGACGTAAVITPIESILFRGKEIVYLPDSKPGPHCTALYKALTAIQFGDAEDKYGWTEVIEL